jgi:hypothetical protein
LAACWLNDAGFGRRNVMLILPGREDAGVYSSTGRIPSPARKRFIWTLSV